MYYVEESRTLSIVVSIIYSVILCDFIIELKFILIHFFIKNGVKNEKMYK